MNESGLERLAPAAIAVLAGFVTWLAMLSWRGFTEDPAGYLGPLVRIIVVVVVIGIVGRQLRIPGLITVAVQIVVGVSVTSQLISSTWVPRDEAWQALSNAVESARLYAAPVPEGDGVSVHALILVAGLFAILIVDILASSLRHVPMAGLPLLTIYTVPVSVLTQAPPWWEFGTVALGFLLMLYLQEQHRTASWGRDLGEGVVARTAVAQGSSSRSSIRASALAIAVATVGSAVLIAPLVPTWDAELFKTGGGGGDSGNEIKVENPLVDMRRDLRRGPDVPLIEMVTSDPDPKYLRISVLNRFSQNEWSSGDREVPDENTASGRVPEPFGVSDSLERTRYEYDMVVRDEFESTWLPTQPLITRIEAEGDWRYDRNTMDFIASDDDLTTAGLEYSMTAVELRYDPAAMSLASETGPEEVGAELLDLPPSASAAVEPYLREAVGDTQDPLEQAQRLQSWFRDRGDFLYSLERSQPGSGVDELSVFLDGESGRVGYCEQFAAAMAVMARELGIPARVAVGFLEATLTPEGTYVYSAHDLHAWPELYFAGAGWVRFEPTPADRAPGVPDYSRSSAPVPEPSANPGGTGGPSETAPQQPTRAPTETQANADPATRAAGDDAAAAGGFPWIRVALAVLFVALLVVALVLPGVVRRRQRRRRLAGGPESAWAELAATTRDLGRPWAEGLSPRDTAKELTEHFGDPFNETAPGFLPRHGPGECPEAVLALNRIAEEVERARYARAHRAAPGALTESVELCIRSLEAGVRDRDRRRARHWPRSLLRNDELLDLSVREPDSDREGRVVEHI